MSWSNHLAKEGEFGEEVWNMWNQRQPSDARVGWRDVLVGWILWAVCILALGLASMF